MVQTMLAPYFWSPLRSIGVLCIATLLVGCSSAEERAKAYYQNGTTLASHGDFVKASLEFRNALKLKASDIEALMGLAEAQERLGNYSEAAKDYLAAANADAKNIEARVKLSSLLLAGGQLDEAEKYITQASAIAPTDPTVLVSKAVIALKRGNAASAVALAQEALKQQPSSLDALIVLASERLNAGDSKGALVFLDRAAPGNDSNVGLQMLRLTALDAAGDQQGVEKLFGKLMGLFPDTPAFRDAFVKWYVGKGRKDDAERLMQQYTAAHPTDDQSELSYTAFLNTEHGSQRALEELQNAITLRSQKGTDAFQLNMALAQLQFVSGKPGEAITLLQSLAKSADPKQHSAATIQLAKFLVSEKNPDQANALATTVLANDAGNVDALTVRASALFALGDSSGATRDLLAALNQSPDNATLHGMLASAYDQAGSVALAEQEYAKAMALARNSAPTGLAMARFFLRYGKTDQAQRTLTSVREHAPDDRDVLTLLAQLKLSSQDWAGAQEIADTLKKLDGDKSSAAAIRIAAAALNGQNRFSDSITLLQTWLAAGGDSAAVLPDLVASYMHAKNVDGAVQYPKTLLAGSPNNVEAQILLGSVYLSQGQSALAETALVAAATADTGVQGSVALAQFYVTRGNLKAGEAILDKGLVRDESSFALRQLRAGVYEQEQRFDEAIADYEVLFKQDPSSVIIANDLASLLSERRNDAASLARATDIARRLQGTQVPQYLDTLGWISYRSGDLPSAINQLKAAADKLPDVAMIQYHLGITLQQLGQGDAAKAALQKAISLSPPLFDVDLGLTKQALRELGENTSSSSSSSG